jgi:hypothetical protein
METDGKAVEDLQRGGIDHIDVVRCDVRHIDPRQRALHCGAQVLRADLAVDVVAIRNRRHARIGVRLLGGLLGRLFGRLLGRGAARRQHGERQAKRLKRAAELACAWGGKDCHRRRLQKRDSKQLRAQSAGAPRTGAPVPAGHRSHTGAVASTCLMASAGVVHLLRPPAIDSVFVPSPACAGEGWGVREGPLAASPCGAIAPCRTKQRERE